MLELQFSPFPALETDRILLRRVTLNDIEDLFRLRSSAEAMKFIDKPIAQSTNEVIELIGRMDQLIDSNDGIAWGLILKETNILIGQLGYHRVDKENHRAEIGYMLEPSYWKKGIISEAVSLIIKYGFEEMKLHSIEAKINPKNLASRKTLEKFNFVSEAYFKEDYLYRGQFLDTEIFSLLTKI